MPRMIGTEIEQCDECPYFVNKSGRCSEDRDSRICPDSGTPDWCSLPEIKEK